MPRVSLAEPSPSPSLLAGLGDRDPRAAQRTRGASASTVGPTAGGRRVAQTHPGWPWGPFPSPVPPVVGRAGAGGRTGCGAEANRTAGEERDGGCPGGAGRVKVGTDFGAKYKPCTGLAGGGSRVRPSLATPEWREMLVLMLSRSSWAVQSQPLCPHLEFTAFISFRDMEIKRVWQEPTSERPKTTVWKWRKT